MNWRKFGFTQRKPTKPGVYFMATDGHLQMAPAQCLREHWDVVKIIFYAGSFTNAHDNYEDCAHWRITGLNSGIANQGFQLHYRVLF